MKLWKHVAATAALVMAMLGLPVVVHAESNDQHQHVRITNHPVDGKPIPRAKYTFNLVLQTHDMLGTATSIRVGDGSTVKKTISVSLSGTQVVTLPFEVDFSTWSVGRHELRWTLNRPATDKYPRIYQSSGWQVCIESCANNISGRATPFIEARGWLGGNYSNVRILTAVRDLRAGNKFYVQAANVAVSGECLFNPNLHAGDRGTSLGRFGTSKVQLTIPATAVPGDKIVCFARNSAATSAGVLAIVLPSAADPVTVDIESQGWWNTTGLVIR